jgi:uncharacterized repeat protein (TIGR01451 family)
MYTPYLRVRSLALTRGLSLMMVLALGLAALLTMRPLVAPTTIPALNVNSDSIKLPLSFVPNAGQTKSAVHFEVHDMGGTIFFTSGETVLALPATTQTPSSVVRLHFEGANPAPAVVGVNRLPGIVNYFIGDDPALWRTNVPTYAGIVYRQLYPGIDLSYEGTNGQLKSTYTVAPAADPSLIRWRHNGATSVRVDETTGNLLVALAGSTLIEQAPIAWQEIDGQRVSVTARYVLANDGAVGFALGGYDAAKPLIVDPTLSYSTYLGGSDFDQAGSVALDGEGNIYVVGTTFDGWNGDVFVTKINAAGSALVYSTYLSGNDDDEGNGIAVDGDGYAYVTGATDSTNFPTQNPLQDRGGMEDAFVAKLNADGSALVYSSYLGGSGLEDGGSIAVDGDGNAYVTGTAFSGGWLAGTYNGNCEAFVVKVNASGSALVYGTYLGGSSDDFGVGIAVSGSNAYVLGQTFSGNFPTASPLQASYGGFGDAFVAKLNDSGSALLYSTYLGGSGKDYSYGIAVSDGNAYVTGQTESADFPTTLGAFDTTCGTDGECNNNTGFYSYGDAFVAKLNDSGSALLYSTYLGGSGVDKGYSIAVDAGGGIYVTGDTDSADFPAYGSLQFYAGGSDAFVTKLKADGALAYSTYLGGDSGDYGTGVAAITLDSTTYAVVTGITFSEDFPTENPLQATHGGGEADAFVVKLVGEETPLPPAGPNLAGSYKSASKNIVVSEEKFTYTIHLQNSGTAGATADVVDQLPPQVDYVPGSASHGGDYDPGTETLSWSGIEVPSGDEVLLTFQVTAMTVDAPTVAMNTATITSDGDTFERKAAVLLVSELPGDVIPPMVDSLTIDDQDVLTNPAVTLHISASDNVGVTQMYLKEWMLVTKPVPHWQVVQSSGWVPYQEEYPWTLVSESGVHFVSVWVADGEGNVSHLNRNGLDYASLLLAGETVSKNDMVPYLVSYDAGVDVTATLNTTSGDADLYVWYPDKYGLPDESSVEPGTDPDEVTFTTPEAGTYLFLVHGAEASTYNLTITPAGGPRAWGMSAAQAGQTARTTSVETTAGKTPLTEEQVLRWSGLDPLPQAKTPAGPFVIYLPVVFR